MVKDNILRNLTKPKKTLLVLGLIIIVIGLFGGGILTFFVSKEDATNLRDVNEPNIYSEVDVSLVTSYFATLETNNSLEKYYFITDTEGYLYIAKMDDETFAKLKANYDYNYSTDPTLEEPDSVMISGTSEEIPSDIANFAVEYLQEDLGLSEVNINNYNNVIYPFLINTYITKTNTIMDIAIVFGIITVIGLVILMFYINKQAKIKDNIYKYRKSLDEVEQELEDSKVIYNSLCKIYITTNYIISYKNGLNILNINDIIWLYPYEVKQSGITTSSSICIVTNTKKKYFVGKINITNKDKEEAYNELYNILLQKTPDALHGYSKENQEKIYNTK